MKRAQRGMTLIGFVITLAVVGIFVYMGMKLVPMYSEFYAVKSSLKGVATDAEAQSGGPSAIRASFIRRLYINYSENVKEEHLKIVPKDSGYLVTVNYEVRRPLFYNIDVVGKFNTEQEVRRTSAN